MLACSDVLPDDVKALRTELGLTLRALAEHLGVDIKDVLAWEAGERFPTKRHVGRMQALRGGKAAAKTTARRDPGSFGASAASFTALANPELWRLFRKLVAHPELFDATLKLAARYDDPAKDAD